MRVLHSFFYLGGRQPFRTLSFGVGVLVQVSVKIARGLTPTVELMGAVGLLALAAAWTLSNPAVTGAIIGARNARQVQEVFPHADLVVTRDELRDAGS